MKTPLAITAVALGLAAAAPIGSAMAHPVSVQIGVPVVDVRIGVPVPRLFIPAPVVVAPAPVYAPPPAVPRPVFYAAPYYGRHDQRYEPRYRHDWDGRGDERHRHWDARTGRWCD